jgi:hypothetical protein
LKKLQGIHLKWKTANRPPWLKATNLIDIN